MIVLGMVGGWLCRGCLADDTPIVQRDTLVYRDTIRESYPVEVSRETIDTMYVTLTDTIRIKETAYLPLPLEKKIYASDEYYAEISGYKPNLDYIEVFPKTTIITEKIAPERKKNTIGIGVDVGYMNALSIPIYLEYERMLHKNVGIYGQVFYDLPSRRIGAGLGVKMQLEW
jgi:hypothetical protein